MKAFLILLIASTSIYAGENTAIASSDVVAVDNCNSGLYLGLGYGLVGFDLTKTANVSGKRSTATRDTKHHSALLQVGYQFNRYFAVEGRYWAAKSVDFVISSTSKSNPNRTKTLSALSIYLKPILPLGDSLTAYGLLGYTAMRSNFIVHKNAGKPDNINKLNDRDFSWGAGLSYKINDRWSVFADYVRIYDDTVTAYLAKPLTGKKDWKMRINSINIGVNYRF